MSTVKLSRLAWMHEDDLPRMKDETFKKLLPLSQEQNGARYFPYVTVADEHIFLTTAFPARLKREV